MSAATTNNPVTPEAAADLVDTGANAAASAIEGVIPFGLGSLFDIKKRLTSSNHVKKLQSEARDVIVKEGNDKSSWLGQIFEWIGNLFQSIGTWLDKTFGSAEPAPATPTVANSAGTPAKPTGDSKTAQAAAEAAKPNTPVNGGVNTEAPAAPSNTPGKTSTVTPAVKK